MANNRYDAIVVGGGHNGLVAAGYLVRAGWKVLVLERYDRVGGACVTEEVFPGYRVSTAAYVNSLLRPEILRDFDLAARGYRLLVRDPSSFSPTKDGRSLMFWSDSKRTFDEIAKFSRRDAERYPGYEAELERVARVLEPMLLEPPPDPAGRGIGELFRLLRTGLRLKREIEPIVRLFTMSAADYIERWFESEPLKARLATDGVIGAWAGPRTPGTAYVLFHHVMGQADGQRGVWGYVQGGMGTISEALADYVRSKDGVIVTNADVQRIEVRGGSVHGIVLADGREFVSKVVLSNADPKRTFLQLLDPATLPSDVLDEMAAYRCRSGVVKINVALSGLPSFLARPGDAPAPHHRGTIHFCDSMDEIERAFDDAKSGRPSDRPIVEMCLPSVVDPSLAPPGRHLASLFVQYAPYDRSDGKDWNEQTEREFAERAFAVVSEYAPNWNAIVDDYQVLTPPGLEKRFGMTGGNIFHGEMTLDQLAFLRPARALSRYRTPVQGLYLCGSGVHPGGGVMGAPGYLAAKTVLRDVRHP